MSQSEYTFGEKVIANWLDSQDEIITAEASLAGLLEHGTAIGNAREFFINRVLRTILPPIVHVGTGVVFGEAAKSKQIDVVLYDSRFPVYEIEPGFGMYPIEGVICTIEIKSFLDKKELVLSLIHI